MATHGWARPGWAWQGRQRRTEMDKKITVQTFEGLTHEIPAASFFDFIDAEKSRRAKSGWNPDRQITDLKSVVADWCCIDCGLNTAPGFSTRAEIQEAYYAGDLKEGIAQRIDDQTEIYTVRDAVWRKAGMEPRGGCLCIGCLEKRIGRKLKPKDFPRDDAFNHPGLPGTERLLNRRK
jgi:hypothetical protein